MKALCTTENLKRGILIAEKIIGKNLTLPILSNILLEAEKGGLKVSATNLEIGLITKIRAKIEKEGKIAVPGKIMGGILAQLEDGNKITLEEKNSTLKMIYNGNSAAIKGMDAKDFPIIPKPESKFLFEISAAEMQKKAGNVLATAAVSDTRQELTGAHFEFGETKITLAATDSFRLSEATIKLDKTKLTEDYKKYLAKNSAVIVPARTLAEVIRSVSTDDESVKVYLAENQIFFETADVLFVSRLIDGKYPEYKQVVPKEFSLNMIAKKEDLLKAARLAGVFSDSKSREVRLKIEGGKGKIMVFAESVESGEGAWSIDCQADAKNDLEVAFNNRFLLDGLSSISTEDIYIGANDSFGPVMLREVVAGKPQLDYFHIIMPIRS
jgi:DNA polymerase III subunit beta